VREALNVVCVVDCAGEGAGLDEMSPPGDVQCQPAKLRRAVKDGPTGPSAASCEAASLTARNSGATREITRGRGSETLARAGRRNGELPTSCLLLGVSAAPLPRHGNHLRGGPPDPDSHLRSCQESLKSDAREPPDAAASAVDRCDLVPAARPHTPPTAGSALPAGVMFDLDCESADRGRQALVVPDQQSPHGREASPERRSTSCLKARAGRAARR
jgi:hypothetical protein